LKYSHEDVVKILNDLGYELIDNKYPGARKPIVLKDLEGYLYVTTFSGFNQLIKEGHSPSKFTIHNIYTIKNIKLWCKINNKPYELISEVYINAKDNLNWKCLKEDCGEMFEKNWHDIYSNRGCPFCAGFQVGLSNCLATKFPKIANEWHPTKNGDLTPYDVTCGCDKEIWWQCNRGHEWNVAINTRINTSRINNNSCPYCSRRLPTEDYNLLIIHPIACEEWDYDKNDRRPEEYLPNANQYAFWICRKCGNKWEQIISDRVNRGKTGCPECKVYVATNEYNLLVNNSELCEEWNYDKNNTKPENYTPNSGQYAWWICKDCGNEWETQICSRNGRGNGCPRCAESKGEKRITKFLKQYNIYHIPQKSFNGLVGLGNGLLSYDFYLPKYNLLVEFQGEQHEHFVEWFYESIEDFEKQQEHDRRKKEYAEQNGYNFLEIWYWDSNNIEKILLDNIL